MMDDDRRGYLDRAVKRCRLPISVRSDPAYPWCPHERWRIHINGVEAGYGWYPSDTAAAYLALCRELDPTAV